MAYAGHKWVSETHKRFSIGYVHIYTRANEAWYGAASGAAHSTAL